MHLTLQALHNSLGELFTLVYDTIWTKLDFTISSQSRPEAQNLKD